MISAPIPGLQLFAKRLVGPGGSSRLAVKLMEGPGGQRPFEEPPISMTERRFEALPFTGGVTVKGHGKVVDASD
jgi:hypothetical protein